MRTALSDALVAAADADERVLLLTGDHGYALFDAFRKAHPDRFINCGIAEQNMVGMAAGLAKAGFRPIVYGLAAFVPIRVLEQIKIDVCYENLPVIFLGDGAGMVYSHLGTSHQCTEDIAVLRAIANLSVFSPADRHELTWSMTKMLSAPGAAYMRVGKADLGDVHQEPVAGDMHDDGMIDVIDGGSSTLCIATGSMTAISLRAIREGGLSCDLLSIPRIKPFDEQGLLCRIAGRRRIVTLEEHSIYGGLGAAVAEVIAGRFLGSFERIGVRDRFSEECGNYEHLLRLQGLDATSVRDALALA